ncbi:MAG: helix-turn-helix domain containing protein [Chloroflexi bacterium]|nr:helix-turn-helix domain containing protein [Chloroflexota bacterium]
MTRRQKDPLRLLVDEEWTILTQISRAQSEAAGHVARAKALLAVASGQSYTDAARAAGRKSGDAVSQLVSRFNREGLAAIEPRHGGGPETVYGVEERKRILTEFERQPDREKDGTATWSLSTLQRALREAPDGLPNVSTYIIWSVLRDAGWTWQKNRAWCRTGTVTRKRKGVLVEVTDPEAEEKKLDRAGLQNRRVTGLECLDTGRGRAVSDHSL